MNKLILILLFAIQSDETLTLSDQTNYQNQVKVENLKEKFSKNEVIISYFENIINNFDKMSFYNQIYKGSKEKNLWRLESNELNSFYIYQAQSISDMLYVINVIWSKDLSNLKEKEEKESLTKLINKLKELRSKHAIKFEKLLEERLQNVSDLTEDEKQNLLIKIKNWNENQNLIDRKK